MSALTTVGLLGSSHISRFPLPIFREHLIKPIIVSDNPRNTQAFIQNNTIQSILTYITTQNITLDYIFIMIGANDIGRLTHRQITNNLIHIAQHFQKLNITPIIAPIINRESPRNITRAVYNTNRNHINKALRKHFKKHNQQNLLKIHNLKLNNDGVHLTQSSYKTLAKAIKHHITRHITLTQSNIAEYMHLEPGHYIDTQSNEEITIEHIME